MLHPKNGKRKEAKRHAKRISFRFVPHRNEHIFDAKPADPTDDPNYCIWDLSSSSHSYLFFSAISTARLSDGGATETAAAKTSTLRRLSQAGLDILGDLTVQRSMTPRDNASENVTYTKEVVKENTVHLSILETSAALYGGEKRAEDLHHGGAYMRRVEEELTKFFLSFKAEHGL